MKLSYLITGTGRSGTVFMARLLTSVGIPCGHESIFDWRGIRWAEKRLKGEEPLELSYASQTKWENGNWKHLGNWLGDTKSIVAESSYMAAPFLKEKLIEGVPVIHVLRHPVNVVQSFVNHIGYFFSNEATNSYEQFIYRHVPELKKEMPVYDRAALFWVRWNQMVENASPKFVYRVEDDTNNLLEFLGRKGEHFKDTTINSYKKENVEQFSVDKIKSNEIRSEFISFGKKYDYRILSEYLMI
jgi:hypothetical protein